MGDGALVADAVAKWVAVMQTPSIKKKRIVINDDTSNAVAARRRFSL